jgi:hypothetical protein|tara:strand:- start:283 stop:408 length:126 start_codon:yes stop_codon:yes gene_type:complete
MPNQEILFGKFGKPLRQRTISDDKKDLLDDEFLDDDLDETE